ncbi:MAG: tetratricopeptide repeat protein, partial [Magnetococcales bacterium]|nr:tetratricopeptide repeat protein [Magnetococcales bacterium]
MSLDQESVTTLRTILDHLSNGAYGTAEQMTGQWLDHNSDSAEGHALHALAAHFQNRHEEAIERFDRAIVLDGSKGDFHANRGASLAALGRYVEAIDAFQNALTLTPGDLSTTANLARALVHLKRHTEAVALLAQIVAAVPDDPVLLTDLGVALSA